MFEIQTKWFGYRTSFESRTVWQWDTFWNVRKPNVRFLDVYCIWAVYSTNNFLDTTDFWRLPFKTFLFSPIWTLVHWGLSVWRHKTNATKNCKSCQDKNYLKRILETNDLLQSSSNKDKQINWKSEKALLVYPGVSFWIFGIGRCAACPTVYSFWGQKSWLNSKLGQIIWLRKIIWKYLVFVSLFGTRIRSKQASLLVLHLKQITF